MLFLLLYLLTTPFSLDAAESVTKTFTVTVEAAESVSVSGNVTINSGFTFNSSTGVMYATDTSTTMDLVSPAGSARVLNVSYDALNAEMTLKTWITGGSPTGTGTNNYTSSGSSLTLSDTAASIITGMDDYTFTGATIGYMIEATADAPTTTQNVTVTWAIAAP